MTQFKFIPLLLALISLHSSDLSAQANVEVDKQTKEHLNKFRSDYIQGMLQNKPESFSSFYSANVWFLPAFQKTIMGKTDVLLYHNFFLSRFYVKEYARNKLEIRDLGKQILEVGNFTAKLTLQSGGQEYELTGAYLNLWEKSENGLPTLITEAWNYDKYYEGIDTLLRFDEVPSVHIALLPNVHVNSNISFELAAFNRLLDATVTQHDANVWAQYYTDESMLIPNYHPICLGKKAIDNYLYMHIEELPVFEGLDIRNHRIDDLGDYVIEYASHIASWKNGERSGVGLGKNIRIWRREPDHSLKIFRSIGMYD